MRFSFKIAQFRFNVTRLWCNSDFADINSYREFMEIIKKNNIETVEFKDMPRSYEINGARLKILYPPKDYIDKTKNGGILTTTLL